MDSELKKIISELSQWGNLNSASQFLLKNICKLNDWEYGEIWLPSKDGKFMVWTGFWSKLSKHFEKFSKFSSVHKFAKGIGLVGRTWQQKKVMWIEDIFLNNNFLRTEVASKSGLNSAVSIPFLQNNNVLFILCFFIRNLTPADQQKAIKIFEYSEQIGNEISGLS